MSVRRFSRDKFSKSLKSEYLFDVLGGPYNDFFLFDNYAIAIKDKNVVKAIYFDQFRGGIVLAQAEKEINDELKYFGETFERVTFWDYSGEGDFRMIAAVRSPASIAIYGFDSAINW